MTARSVAVVPAPTEAEEELLLTVGSLVRAHVRLVKEKSRLLGLSAPQMFLLAGLHELGRMPVTRWAEEFGSSPSATTALVDGLVEAGYIERVHDDVDRRQVIVSLTPKGRRLTEGARRESRKTWTEVCEGIPEAELRTTAAVVAKIVAGLESHTLSTDWLTSDIKPTRSGR